VLPRPAPLGGALVEETSLIVRWLGQPGTRIVCATEGFTSPVHSAGPWLGWAATARTARYAASELVAEPRSAIEQTFLPPPHPLVEAAG
jgi:DNA polymerase-3 subunit epsilon